MEKTTAKKQLNALSGSQVLSEKITLGGMLIKKTKFEEKQFRTI